MKNKHIFAALIIILLAVFGSYTVNQNNNADIESTKSTKIGFILPLSGEYGALGENIKKGAELYLSEYNLSHPNQKAEVIFENDELNAPKGLSAYKKLKNIDKVDALISASAPTLGVIYDSIKSENVPTISISSEPREESKDNIFQITPSAEPMYAELGEYLKQNFKGKRIVYVRTNDALIQKFGEHLKASYGEPLKEIITNRSDKNQRTTATKILTEKPDVIVFSNYAEDGNLIIKEIINQTTKDTRPQFVFDPVFTQLFSTYEKVLTNMQNLDGSIVFSIKDYNSPEFIASYTKKYNDKPSQMSDVGYDSLKILLESRSADKQNWINNIEKTDTVGASGNITFNSKGQRLPTYNITRITDGKIPVYQENN